MTVRHGDHAHEVTLLDDGTLDTVLEIDEQELRFMEADRDHYGMVRPAWIRNVVREACDDGLFDNHQDEGGC